MTSDDRIRRWLLLPLSLLLVLATAAGAQAPDLGQAYRERRALVIGIDSYLHWKPLGYARRDAEAVGKKLASLGFRVDYLLDREATRDAITARLSALSREVVKRDQVLIYFSGHGQTEEGGVVKETLGYIVPVDGRPDDPFQSAISMAQLQVLAKRLRAYHVMFALDACFSGTLLATAKGPAGTRERTPAYVREMLQTPVRFVLTAGTARQEAFEVGGHGVFTRHFLAALDGAAARPGSGGLVTGDDIGAFVQRSVMEEAARYGRKLTPQVGKMPGQGDGEFLLALRVAKLPPEVERKTLKPPVKEPPAVPLGNRRDVAAPLPPPPPPPPVQTHAPIDLGVKSTVFREHTAEVRSVAFVPGAGRFLSAGADGTIRLWDVADEKPIRTFNSGGRGKYVESVVATEDGFLSTSHDGVFGGVTVCSWSWKYDEDQYTACMKLAQAPLPTRIAGSPTNKTFILSWLGFAVFNRKPWEAWNVPSIQNHLWWAAIAPDDSEGVIANAVGEVLRVDPSNKEITRLAKVSEPRNVAYLEQKLVLIQTPVDIRILDTTSGNETRVVALSAGRVETTSNIAVSPTKQLAIFGCGASICLSHVGTGRELGRLFGHTNSVGSIALSSDDRLLLSGANDGTVRLWELWRHELR